MRGFYFKTNRLEKAKRFFFFFFWFLLFFSFLLSGAGLQSSDFHVLVVILQKCQGFKALDTSWILKEHASWIFLIAARGPEGSVGWGSQHFLFGGEQGQILQECFLAIIFWVCTLCFSLKIHTGEGIDQYPSVTCLASGFP